MCLGIPGQIVEIRDADNNLALVDVGGVQRVIIHYKRDEPSRRGRSHAHACVIA